MVVRMEARKQHQMEEKAYRTKLTQVNFLIRSEFIFSNKVAVVHGAWHKEKYMLREGEWGKHEKRIN
jgi:hypothetical protein